MSDHDEPARDVPPDDAALQDDFDDPAHKELRALLAETRVTEPVPPDVAARLDLTLSTLRDQRRAESRRSDGKVVRLRRRAGQALVAAAAVAVVGGAAVGIVHGGPNGNANADKASNASVGREDTSGSTSSRAPHKTVPTPAQALKGLAVARRLTTAHFARDVTLTMRRLALVNGDFPAHGYAPSTTSPQDSSGTLDSRSPEARPAPPVTATPTPLSGTSGTTHGTNGCADPGIPGAVSIAAVLDGAPVTLVFRPPTEDAQVVEAWSCDGTTVLASTTVPH